MMAWSKETVEAEHAKACATQAKLAVEVNVLEKMLDRAARDLLAANEQVKQLRNELVAKTIAEVPRG